MEFEELARMLPQVVPFVGTLGIRYDEAGPEAARLTLPDRPALHNHLGQPHAGALFTLAESAAGAVVVSASGHLLDRLAPVVTRSAVVFHRAAHGETTAEATAVADVFEAVAAAEAGERATFAVSVTVRDSRGVHVATADFSWALIAIHVPTSH